MKVQSKIVRVALVTAAVSLTLALPMPRRSSARQSDGRGAGIVFIKVEDGREVKLYERSYALVIGVSDYTQGWPKLPGVKKDIEEVARALERHGFLVTKVENPDSAQLDKSFKDFISAHGRGVENRLLFYFAGHGQTVKQSYGEEMGYIVPTDAPNPARDLNGFLDKALNMRQVERYAEDIQAKHALFLFDSCFSGALFALSRARPDSIGYKTSLHVRQFITSGSADEQVPDQSIFRRQFVEALDGEADLNRDGYVTGTELGMFLQDKVINYSHNAQHPQYGKLRNPNLDKGDFVFALPQPPKPSAAKRRNTFVPFDNVNGIRPGHSTRSDVELILGQPQSVERIKSTLTEATADLFKYPRKGIYVSVNSATVDFVYVEAPYDGRTPEGLYIGMPEQRARAILNSSFVQGRGFLENFYSKKGSVEETKADFQVWFKGNKLIRMKIYRHIDGPTRPPLSPPARVLPSLLTSLYQARGLSLSGRVRCSGSGGGICGW